MARPSTQPILFNELPAITIRNLRDGGLLDGGYYRKTIRWRSTSPLDYDEMVSEIEIIVDTEHSYPSIRFVYASGEDEFDYLVPLKRKLTNSGIGMVWYFVPEPDMLCLKLYMHDNRFVGRKQIKGAFYRCQVLVSTRKRINNFNVRLAKIDKIIKHWQQPFYKQVYRGINTKHTIKVQAAFEEMKMLAKVNLRK